MYDQDIADITAEITKIYKDIHRHPEMGFREHRTAAIVAEYLRACGLDVREGLAMTGVVGVLDSGKPGKTLLIRADMDCLMIDEQTECTYQSGYPHRMHACGHDTHVSMLLGAAKVLSRHRNGFCGKIKFVFEPAEEGWDPADQDMVVNANCQSGGAATLVREGIMDDVDVCFIIHNEPALPVGTLRIPVERAYASSDVFEITLTGKGGHGARPQNTIDPVPAMAELISAIYMISAREISCLEPCVITIGAAQTIGSVWNSVPEKVYITGGFRAFKLEISDYIYKRLPEITGHIASSHGCTAETKIRHGLHPTVNDPRISRIVADACRDVLGAENVCLCDYPTMASESAGHYLSKKPGAIVRLGSGDLDHELHNPHMLPDLKVLPTGIAVHVHTALALLKHDL